MKKHLALTTALTLALIGGGTSAAFADDTTPSEVAPSASTPTTQAPTSPSEPVSPSPASGGDETSTSGTPTSTASPVVTPQPTEPTPSTNPAPVETPSPTSEPEVPAPVSTTAPAPEPTVEVDASWLMPAGGTREHATYPQTAYLEPVCGTGLIQHDHMVGTQSEIDAVLADGRLDEGEDYGLTVSWTFEDQVPCVVVPPKPTPTTTEVVTRGTPDCTGGTTEVTLTTTTTTFVYNEAKNTWVEGEPIIDTSATYVDNEAGDCPIATPPSKPSAPVGDVNIQPAVDRVTTPVVAATAPDSLAFTGSNTDRFIEWTFLLLSLGAICFAIGKRPRREGKE